MRLLIRHAFAAALVIAVAALHACAPAPAAPGPALWKLEDSDSEIWLFGTVHMLPADMEWRNARVTNAFAAADTIYFETPLGEPAQADIAALVGRLGYNPPGVTLSSLLPAEDRARLIRACARLELDPLTLEPARPWLAAVRLSVTQAMARGRTATGGVDQALDQMAQAQGKRRAYFETGEQQVRFFADLPRATEVQFLRTTLREIEQDAGAVEAMDEAWARGDLGMIDRELRKMAAEAGPEIYEALIQARNERWADEIDAMMKSSGRVFIAVGAAHMVGADGLPALLRKKGYRVVGPS